MRAVARESPPLRQRTNEHAVVVAVRGHAYAVAQNGAARNGTRRIHGDYAHCATAFAEVCDQRADERRFSNPRRPGHANHVGPSQVSANIAGYRGAARAAGFDCGNRLGDGGAVSPAQVVNQRIVHGGVHSGRHVHATMSG